MRKLVAATLLLVFVFPMDVVAYELATHGAVTYRAFQQSILVQESRLMSDLGISVSANPFGSVHFDVAGAEVRERGEHPFEGAIIKQDLQRSLGVVDPLSLPGWLMRGAIREDDWPGLPICGMRADNPQDDPHPDPPQRPRNHFFDPYNNRPLTVLFASRGQKAPDWAGGVRDVFNQPNNPDTTRRNHFTVLDAREAMYRALTGRDVKSNVLEAITGGALKTPLEIRKGYWATTFRALGDVVHLIQDMAQPQHTRNDAHAGACVDAISGHASVYEFYIDARAKQQKQYRIDGTTIDMSPLPSDINYPVPSFHRYSDYFSTSPGQGSLSGKGLADYSNRGFFTAGTNLGSTGSNPLPLNDRGVYRDELVDLADLLSGDPTIKMYFLQGEVTDFNVLPGAQPSKDSILMTTESIWDRAFDPSIPVSRFYSLNRVNYDDQARLLIPRAVAYSAGLINYFFRGKIDFVPDPESTTGGWLIKNLGAEPMEGTFALYYDDKDGNRYPVDGAKWTNVKLAAAGASTPDLSDHHPVASFAPPVDPAPAKPGEYMLVFNGDMGEEKADVSNGVVGAVAAKHIVPVYAGTLYVLGLDASNRPVSLKVDDKGTHLVSGYDSQGVLHNPNEFDPLTTVGMVTDWDPGGAAVLLKQAKVTESNGQLVFEPIAVSLEAYTSIYNTFSYVKDRATGQWSARSLPTWLVEHDPAFGDFEIAISFAGSRTAATNVRYQRTFVDGGQQKTEGGVVVGGGGLVISDGQIYVSGDGKRAGEVTEPAGGTFPNDSHRFSDIVVSVGALPSVSKVLAKELRNSGVSNLVWPPDCTVEPISDGALYTNCDISLNSPAVSVSRIQVGTGSSEFRWRRTLGAVGGGKKVLERSLVGNYSAEFNSLLRHEVHVPCQKHAEWHIRSQQRYVYSAVLTDGSIEATSLGQLRNYNSDGVVDTECMPPAVGTSQVTHPGPDSVWEGRNVVWATGDKTGDAVYEIAGVWDRYYFRDKPFSLSEAPVYDVSPVGEIFFASSDLTVVEHDPKLGMKKIEIPPHVAKIIAALWL